MDLYAGKYPIVIGPAYEDALTSIIYANKGFFREYYCSVSVGTHLIGYSPSLPSRFVVFLHEEEVCTQMKVKAYSYYLENYDDFCHRGKATADIIDIILEKDGVDNDKKCNTLIKTTDYIIPAHFQAVALVFSILLILLCKMILVTYKQ